MDFYHLEVGAPRKNIYTYFVLFAIYFSWPYLEEDVMMCIHSQSVVVSVMYIGHSGDNIQVRVLMLWCPKTIFKFSLFSFNSTKNMLK